jgi:hypothetical protein
MDILVWHCVGGMIMGALGEHSRLGGERGLHDRRVASASAKMAREHFPNVLFAGVRIIAKYGIERD